jgi:type III restriction enzyme
MSVKIKFDPNQDYQLEAIQSVVDVFKGQTTGISDTNTELATDAFFDLSSVQNRLTLSHEELLANIQAVQAVNEIPVSNTLAQLIVEHEPPVNLNLNIEMETGTGKTYVYLRTIYELHKQYGLTKFIIAVPTVAIREGVLSTLRLTEDHFRSLYGAVPVDAWIYDSRQVSRLRQFASSQDVQILIMNVSAFDKDNNLLYRHDDRLNGFAPIQFIQAVRPVVIVDEPQNFEGEQARRGLTRLYPTALVRYSATHRTAFNTLYKLGPVQAYDLRLVKQIEVLSVLDSEDFNKPHLRLVEIKPSKTTVKAKLEIDRWDNLKGGPGVKRKTITVSKDSDLYTESGEREVYSGFTVTDISVGDGIEFSNGQFLALGQTIGTNPQDIMRAQIVETVREHLNREVRLSRLPAGERLKVLSLIFIDRVANYRGEDARIRRFFEEAYTELSAEPRYAMLKLPPLEAVHAGYFSEDRSGNVKDTRGDSQADEDTYAKIMRDKETLLSLEEPLRFIFSHSALREGWDNPNVFQICTLNESTSEVRKRQEIGRGLRLPVRENGERSHDLEINRLLIVANESYKDFAATLQKEIETDTGNSAPRELIQNARERRTLKFRKEVLLDADFQTLWEKIRPRTRYKVSFDTEKFISKAAEEIHKLPAIHTPAYSVQRGRIDTFADGGSVSMTAAREVAISGYIPFMPDILGHLQRETELTRSTLVRILEQSGRVGSASANPQKFLDMTLHSIKHILQEAMVDGIKYEQIGENYDMTQFESRELETYLSKTLDIKHGIYDAIAYDSDIERKFAAILDEREDVKLFVKLPKWFVVPTPLGNYEPDWAVVIEDEGKEKLYFVCETKSTKDSTKLRSSENLKIACGHAHFHELGVPFVLEISGEALTPEQVRRSTTS